MRNRKSEKCKEEEGMRREKEEVGVAWQQLAYGIGIQDTL